jgi:hypothetical protein
MMGEFVEPGIITGALEIQLENKAVYPTDSIG